MSNLSPSARHDCRILLIENTVECSSVSAHYLRMVPQYADLNNQAGMRYSLKCAVEHLKVAVASFKEFEALDAPKELSEAAP